MQHRLQEVTQEIEDVMLMPLEWFLTKIYLDKMPTVFYINGFRFFFYSNDHLPKHIHIENGDKTAKFYLENAELVKSFGFKPNELKQIRILVEENQELLIQKWDEYFNN